MSTRSTTHFIDGNPEKPAAIIYRHPDGYPEGHGVDLYRFFDAVKEQTSDTRFDDAGYLAAKLVVYLSRQFASSFEHTPGGYENVSHADTRPLDFLSVGVMMQDPGDIEYRYTVDVSKHDDAGYPLVTCNEVGGTWEAPELGAVVPIPREVTA